MIKPFEAGSEASGNLIDAFRHGRALRDAERQEEERKEKLKLEKEMHQHRIREMGLGEKMREFQNKQTMLELLTKNPGAAGITQQEDAGPSSSLASDEATAARPPTAGIDFPRAQGGATVDFSGMEDIGVQPQQMNIADILNEQNRQRLQGSREKISADIEQERQKRALPLAPEREAEFAPGEAPSIVGPKGGKFGETKLGVLEKAAAERAATQRAGIAASAAAGKREKLSEIQKFQATNDLGKQYSTLTKDVRSVQQHVNVIDAAMAEVAKGGSLNAPAQAIISSFNKITDPASVVRESEYARTPEGQALIDQWKGKIDQVSRGGPGMTPRELKEMADFSKKLVGAHTEPLMKQQQLIERRADEFELDTESITGRPRKGTDQTNANAVGKSGATAGGRSGAAEVSSSGVRKVTPGRQKGEVKKFRNGKTGVWDGTGWVAQ